jgi:glycosyltransferase involved in cell wall biosynthesis
MRVALISRATLYKQVGGDTIQIRNTAAALNKAGITADIKLTDEKIDYNQFDLLHFFNLTRPADILFHTKKTHRPYVVTPILVDYSQYDKYYRKRIPGLLFRMLSSDNIEYLKTTARWFTGKDKLMTKSYLWRRQRSCIRDVLKNAAMILPNSALEYQQLAAGYKCQPPFTIVPNGVDTDIFNHDDSTGRDPRLVICVGRIEGIKNQETLIKALNNSSYQLVLIGAPSPNQYNYYRHCRRIAGKNIRFIEHLPQQELAGWYRRAKVHVLPSWFETCSLSSLEAGAMGCNLVLGDKGFTREYYEDHAFYCNPADPSSILNAVEKAAGVDYNHQFRVKILANYTWQKAARQTIVAYNQALQTL